MTAARELAASRQLLCSVCPAEVGVATSAAVQVSLSPRVTPAGCVIAGTKAWVCAHCLSRGKITRLTG